MEVYNQSERNDYKGKKILSEQWEVEFLIKVGEFWYNKQDYYYTENKGMHDKVLSKWKKEYFTKKDVQYKSLNYI